MLSRRYFLAGSAAALAAPAILQARSLWRNYPFSLGVASGDPAPDGFVIWTRIAPEPLSPDGGMGIGIAPVKWQVAADDRFADIVAEGEASARPELAHSVHVEVTGLQPDRPYWYRFVIQGERSLRGRAHTLPRESASPERLRIAVAGCQNYEDGYFTAYRHLAREDVAFVYHYGDYIYEYGADPIRPSFSGDLIQPVRRHEGGRMLFDINDYRQRYSQYRLDADLQRAHAAHPFLMTMDDHEIENNWVGIDSQDDTPPEIFQLRRAQAFQAWYEHMPVRRSALPGPGGIQAHRALHWGNLAQLNLMDTRQYRSDQVCNDQWATPCADINLPGRTVLGQAQEAWLDRNLGASRARWSVIAQQVMMMSLDRRTRDEPEKFVNLDSWAGYEAARQQMLARMARLDNVIVLTGDEHQNYAGELVYRDRPVGVEFVGTSISSGGNGRDLRPGSDRILANNPELKFINDQRGYMLCEVTRDEWRTDFMVMDRVSIPDGTISKRATWTTGPDRAGLRQA